MNAKTRKKIGYLQFQIENIKSQIEEFQSSEEEKIGNVPEPLQDGEAAQGMEQAISAFCGAVDSLDAAISSLDEIG